MDARGILLRACKQNKAICITDTRTTETHAEGTTVYAYGRIRERLVARRTIRAFFRSVPSFASRGGDGKERGRHSLVEVVDDGGACGIAAFLDSA